MYFQQVLLAICAAALQSECLSCALVWPASIPLQDRRSAGTRNMQQSSDRCSQPHKGDWLPALFRAQGCQHCPDLKRTLGVPRLHLSGALKNDTIDSHPKQQLWSFDTSVMLLKSVSGCSAVSELECQPENAHADIAPLCRRPSAGSDDFALTVMLTFQDRGDVHRHLL